MIVNTLNSEMPIKAIELSTKDFERVVASCRKECEAAATVAGFLEGAGHDILIGCIAKSLDNWSSDDFHQWTESLTEKYGLVSATGISILELVDLVSFLMNEPRYRVIERLQRAAIMKTDG
ncbi:MAG: hypothetical protein SAK29_26760 [Scytonema sp. PMC 1069.18]|nr:hypothetical protein [Scytonema sp. PMC 1069.18]MEC4879927.1 hypothetical protein [Scytonema sp. PMC 1070.18]